MNHEHKTGLARLRIISSVTALALFVYPLFAGATDYNFDSGSLTGWTLDVVRDGDSGNSHGDGGLEFLWDDATQHPGAINSDALGDQLGSARAGTYSLFLPNTFPGGALWFVDLVSPELTNDTLWQGINGLSLNLICAKPQIGIKQLWAQILLNVTRISDGQSTYYVPQNYRGQSVFHDISFDWMNITPNFGDLSNYIVDNVRVRLWGTSLDGINPPGGLYLGDVFCYLDNVSPIDNAPVFGLKGSATIGPTTAVGCGAEEPTGYSHDLTLRYDSDFDQSPQLAAARIDFSASNVKRGIGTPGLCDQPQQGINWVNDRVVDLSFLDFDPAEKRYFHTVLVPDDGTGPFDSADYAGATVSLSFAGLPTGCTIPLTDFVASDSVTATALFSCDGGSETACFDSLDNDMDGFTDCADSDCNGRTAGSCTTAQPGICAAGTLTCAAGVASCLADSGPQIEGPAGALVCGDALDNDCDGAVDLSDSDCVAGNTPPGTNVEVCDGTGEVCVTFENVNPPGGDTTVTVVDCGNPPDGIILNQDTPTCVDVQTTAAFDTALVCVPYDDSVCTDPDPVQQRLCELETFDLFRCDNGSCERLFKEQDVDANLICGLTDQFSLFFVGEALDSDSDGIVDLVDNCPLLPNFWQGDSDGDNVGDVCDNCTDVANSGQVDTDLDGYGNHCDCDINQDSFCGGPDFTLFIGCFNAQTGSDPVCKEADMNVDGFVGGPDFTLFIGRFNNSPGPSAYWP